MIKKISPELQDYYLSLAEDCLTKLGIEINRTYILSPDRSADLVFKRALIALFLREEGLSFPDIGAVLNRDHATAIHLINNYALRYQAANPSYFKIAHNIVSRNVKEKIRFHEGEIKELKKQLKRKCN